MATINDIMELAQERNSLVALRERLAARLANAEATAERNREAASAEFTRDDLHNLLDGIIEAPASKASELREPIAELVAAIRAFKGDGQRFAVSASRRVDRKAPAIRAELKKVDAKIAAVDKQLSALGVAA